MISLNEAHNMRLVLENIAPIAREIFIVDSFSSDDTVKIAEEFGVHVVQRKFSGFGDQWNFAMQELRIGSINALSPQFQKYPEPRERGL
jgi:glycosyltransferase involved in cell wall biosynthesis